MEYGARGASVAPTSMARLPWRMARAACAKASSPPASSAATTPQGPLRPRRMEICPVLAA